MTDAESVRECFAILREQAQIGSREMMAAFSVPAAEILALSRLISGTRAEAYNLGCNRGKWFRSGRGLL